MYTRNCRKMYVVGHTFVERRDALFSDAFVTQTSKYVVSAPVAGCSTGQEPSWYQWYQGQQQYGTGMLTRSGSSCHLAATSQLQDSSYHTCVLIHRREGILSISCLLLRDFGFRSSLREQQCHRRQAAVCCLESEI